MESVQFCMGEEPDIEFAGYCGTVEEEVSSCGGCGTEEEPIAADPCCPPSEDCDSREGTCPGENPICGPCIPFHALAEPAFKLAARDAQEKIAAPAVQASRALAEANRRRSNLHAHSPPSFVLARAGPQICIEKCSFLL
jgi:hypothetical protein